MKLVKTQFANVFFAAVIDHAKDLLRNGEAGNLVAGTGLLDYMHFLKLLLDTGRDLQLLLHSLSEEQAAESIAFLRGK